MDINNTTPAGQNGAQPQPVGTTQDPSQSPAEKRRRRKLLTWIIIVGIIDLILLLLLLLLPCKDCTEPVNDNNREPVTPERPQDDVQRIIEERGGDVNAYMQYTIDWNSSGRDDDSDVDAHADEPGGNHIYFDNMCGKLDVDFTTQPRHKVEHISWNRNEIKDGVYVLYVHQYSGTNRDGVKLELKVGDKVYKSSISRVLDLGDAVTIAKLTMREGELVSMDSEYFR